MVRYGRIERIPGKAPKVTENTHAPDGWDDSEEQELVWLSQGAAELARNSLKNIDRKKADECRKQLLEDLRNPK